MNDIDPMLRQAMAQVKGPVDLHPSVSDVHRRARRHYRRRMAATAGAVACTGVATAALIIRRDSTSVSVSSATDSSDLVDAPLPPTTFVPDFGGSTTTFVTPQQTIDASFVWDALSNVQFDPSASGLVYPASSVNVDVMPTAEMFGCTTQECGAMFNYIVWHEIAHVLGFFDLQQMQGMNSGIDFGQPPRTGDVLQSVYSSYAGGLPATTIAGDCCPIPASTIFIPGNENTTTTFSIFDGIMLIDGGAPPGAMEDAYQRLAGYDRTIVPGTGKTVEQTELMPIGNNVAMATAVGGLLGLDGFDTWDPSFTASPVQGTVAVVIGPDYFDRVQNASTEPTAVSTSTSIGP
ncbi:MAG: hypothetical protein JJD93_09325 [Ilumatobacteraceae bacterium]|nr:hypothetical protein [Ilumatobacteraceae bacterium]